MANGPSQITCLSVIVGMCLLVGLVLFAIQRLQVKGREQAAEHLTEVNEELLQLVERLQAQPDDEASARRIRTLTATREWVPGEFYQPSRDLWDRSLRFAFGNLDTASGQMVAYQIVVPLATSAVGDEPQLMHNVLQTFASRPDDRSAQQTIVHCLRGLPINGSQRQWLYDGTLDLLQRTPSSAALAILALEVGRWHLGRSRPGGAVTIYDEQALQNDIAVRRGGSLV